MFSFPKIQQTRNVFSETRFLYLNERRKQTWQPLLTQTGSGIKKIALKRREEWLKPRNVTYFRYFMSICTREISFHPAQVFFVAGIYLLLLPDGIDTSGSSFFDIVFVFNIETKLKQGISQNTEKPFYCTHYNLNV